MPLDSSKFTRFAQFHTTRWSVVVRAQSPSTLAADESLESLCRQYWPPLYASVRSRGHPPHDAQDLTQEFFARLLEKNWLATADRSQGKLRSFLLTAMKRFLANAWDRSQAAKRGGLHAITSSDADEGEHSCWHPPPPCRKNRGVLFLHQSACDYGRCCESELQFASPPVAARNGLVRLRHRRARAVRKQT